MNQDYSDSQEFTDEELPPSADQDGAKPVVATLETRLDASQAIMALNKSEIDQQISTAKAYPRSVQRFQKNAMTMATLDQATAQTMFYALPRGGKTIKGPSVRMAEVVALNWGNLRYGARIVSIDEQFVTAQGTCHDLENNIAASYETKRRITNRDGVRFNDDMIQTTCNAACAIALREAIYKVVPRSLFKAIYEKVQVVAVGKAESMATLRANWIAYFGKMGVTKEQVLAVLERHGENDITMEDLTTLTGLSTALRDGDATVEGVFGYRPDQLKGSKVKTADDINAKLKAADGQKAAAPANGHTNGNGAPANGSANGNGHAAPGPVQQVASQQARKPAPAAPATTPPRPAVPPANTSLPEGFTEADTVPEIMAALAEAGTTTTCMKICQEMGQGLTEGQEAWVQRVKDRRIAEIRAAKSAAGQQTLV